MSKILILSARPYKIKDEETGRIVQGVSIWFLSPNPDSSGEVFGNLPIKASVSESYADALIKAQLPAVCDVDIDVKAGAASKASISIVALQILKSIPIAPLINSASPRAA